MKPEDVYRYLCSCDPRSPYWEMLYGDYDKEDLPEPRQNCSCDNCFYGRDRLALEILRLREEKGKTNEHEG